MTVRGLAPGIVPALIGASLLAGCVAPLPRTPTEPSTALPPATAGSLEATSERIAESLRPDESAFWLLADADFSFDVRLALADEAQSSLDIQYFIWEKDPTSRLYAHRLLLAADRGVHIRLLLDDLTFNNQDGEYYALSLHPNIEVRTFNPWKLRSNIGRAAEFLVRSRRLNHRMHNKIVLADGRFAIIGGRNIGDRYFGLYDEFVQNDLDIMAAGPIVQEVSDSFDLYWNSSESYLVEDVAHKRSLETGLDETRAFIRKVYLDARDRLKAFSLEPIDWTGFLDDLANSYAPGVGHLAQDLPTIGREQPDQLYQPLKEFLASAKEKVLMSSPYLIPDEEMARLLGDLVSRGVEVTILTNSLASNNHMVAHTAYRRWRKRLLRMGVELYEAREDSPVIETYTVPPATPGFLGLHSKAAVVDDRYSFVGSPNLDPRSLVLNTEIGFFVDSTELARRVTALIERDISPDAAWKVTLNSRKPRWTSSAGTVKRQPALGFKQRLLQFFINLLPLKHQA